MRRLKAGIFFGISLSFLFSSVAMAMEVSNSSGDKMGLIILQPQPDGKSIPVYVKAMEPKATVTFEPQVPGPFVVSVGDLATKKTTRLENVASQDKLVFDGSVLKKV